MDTETSMSLNDMTATELFDTSAFAKVDRQLSLSTEDPYYQLFIKQLGLKEIEEDGDCLLAPLHGRNWSLSFHEAAEAMQQLQANRKLSCERTLAALAYVVEQLDRRPLPQYVVAYMCRDLVTRVVLQRFNETTGSTCTNLMDLAYKIGDNVAEANETFDTLRLCDPAMRSGRFLVALMNEIIAVKSQLGILADCDGNPLYQYKVVVDGAGLVALDKKHFSDSIFEPSEKEARRINDTFLKEKRACIEKCLYGADVDNVLVVAGRLRLWHELLKHACSHGKLSFEGTFVECNICCGDSLVSRFSIKEDIRSIFKRIGYNVGDYKKLARDLRMAKTANEKENISKILTLIKDKIRHEIRDEKDDEALRKWSRELEQLKAPNLFAHDADDEKAVYAKIQEASTMVDKYKQKATAIKNNPAFEKAIEWRYEFPELLTETGDFAGFDLVIGNPPDTQRENLSESIHYKQMNYKVFKQTGEVSSLFFELGSKLLRPDYFMSYITSNHWTHAVSADRMRHFLLEETNPLLMVEFEESNRIDEALGGNNVVILQKSRNLHRLMACRIDEMFDPQSTRIDDYVAHKAVTSFINLNGQPLSVGFGIISETEKIIKNKIEQAGVPLRTWDIQLLSGIKTGYDDAFIIDEKTKDVFVRADYKNLDIIKPLLPSECIGRYKPEKSDRWLICIPWHFPLLYDKSITRASKRAEERFVQQYPVIYEHLLQYKDKLIARDSSDLGVVYEWYALQRLNMNHEWDDFTQQKIVWNKESPTSNFCFDYGGCAVLESTCFIIGQHLKYLLGVLNSKLGRYMLKDLPRINNTDKMQISILALEALKIPASNVKTESELILLVNKRTSDADARECEALDRKIDRRVYEIYGMSESEIEFIEKEISIH